jgi:hypothetical protein
LKSINSNELYLRLKSHAFNSSHFVWLWSDLTFLETSNGWIFGITKELGVHLVALEPLPPKESSEGLKEAMLELHEYFKSGTIAFVGINAPFAKTLTDFGYSNFQIGKEPWVDLSDIKPTGHAGRKIRAGRNQAIKSGLRVEEWKLTEIIKDPNKLKVLNEVKELWEAQSFVSLSGFLHGMSFEAIPEDRRCFVALTKDNIVDGILLVTPIETNKSWYFEDMLIRTDSEATRGIGELLVMSAMETLQLAGHKEISLGIVPMTTIGICEFGMEPPANFLKLTKAFQSFMGLFYNASGMELFRRRFKVVRWDKIYLSVLTDKNKKRSKTMQWITVMFAITAAYKPHLQLKPSFIIESIMSPIRRFPTSFSYLLLSVIGFLLTKFIPHHSHLTSENFLFNESLPVWQWPFRTLSSQLVYFDTTQFGFILFALLALIFYIEKEVFERKWAAYAVGFFLLNEIFIRCICGIFFENTSALTFIPALVHFLPTHGEIILLTSLLGFSTVFIGNKKDNYFAYILIVFIVSSLITPMIGFPSIATLYGMTFYIEGYLAGKFYLYFQSKKDALISKNKNEEEA